MDIDIDMNMKVMDVDDVNGLQIVISATGLYRCS